MSALRTLRRRRDEFLQVVVSLVLLLAAARVLVSAGSAGWRNGALYTLADTLASVLPGNVDVPVALFAGVVAGWFLLFALDVTKRVQTLVLLVVGAVVAVWLRQLEHVVDAVGREPLPFLVAALLTAALTALATDRLRASPRADGPNGGSLLRALRVLQFPGASRGLFVLLAVAVTVVTVQYPWMPRESGDPSVLLVFVSGAVAVLALGSFVQYRSRSDVVAVTPDGPVGTEAEVYAFAGLYYVAKRDYSGSPTDETSAYVLDNAIAHPGEWMDRGFDDPVQFAYLPRSLLRRAVEIHSVDYRLSALPAADVDALATGDGLSGLAARLGRGVRRGVGRLLPLSAVSDVRSADTAAEVLRAADTILLVFPFPEDDAPEHVERMARLLDALTIEASLRTKMVVTHADRVETDDDVAFGSASHRDELLVELDERLPDTPEGPSPVAQLQTDLDLFDAVYPVAGTPTQDEEMLGYDRLLDEIDT